MKINYIISFLFITFLSFAVIANINDTDLIGCTELNGSGCVCHSLDRDTSVTVWVEGPDSLHVGETGFYKMFMTGGPAEAGGYNVAGRFGQMVLVDSFSYQNEFVLNELTQAFSLPFPTPQDTIYWDFGYTASDSSAEWDTIYSCGISLMWDSIPDFHDRWNYGPKFPVKIIDNVTPVELISFSAELLEGEIVLKWETASEINNSGFEIQKKNNNNNWEKVAFVEGKGTTSNNSNYIYKDRNYDRNQIFYRLKQIDYNGSFKYSEVVEAGLNDISGYKLYQNYPNPFNPSTTIEFYLPTSGNVKLKVFNATGSEINIPINSFMKSGDHSVSFNASDLSSGIYFYSIETADIRLVKKMLLLK